VPGNRAGRTNADPGAALDADRLSLCNLGQINWAARARCGARPGLVALLPINPFGYSLDTPRRQLLRPAELHRLRECARLHHAPKRSRTDWQDGDVRREPGVSAKVGGPHKAAAGEPAVRVDSHWRTSLLGETSCEGCPGGPPLSGWANHGYFGCTAHATGEQTGEQTSIDKRRPSIHAGWRAECGPRPGTSEALARGVTTPAIRR
jgi:hypothetical protein